MWVWILGFAALAPLVWWLPERARLPFVTAASAAGLALYDPALAAGTLAGVLGFDALLRWLPQRSRGVSRAVCTLLLLALAGVFAWNKLGADGQGLLPTQSGLVLVGYSYLALKLAAAVVDTLRGRSLAVSRGRFLAWNLLLPIFPSGPIETLGHFAGQQPGFDASRVARGLDRLLVGLVKLLLLSYYLGKWSMPILGDPDEHAKLVRLLAIHAFTLRFYLDFSGYSDVAIGAAALLGFEIQENFDRPLVQRNLVRLWQRWHMTLTAWLRDYVFIPLSRSLLRRAPPSSGGLVVAAAQLGTMAFCGLWHGFSWGFLVWGLLQGLGLIGVGILARPLGARFPEPLRAWWRTSAAAHVLAVLLTFHYFSLSTVFAVLGVDRGFSLLIGLVG